MKKAKLCILGKNIENEYKMKQLKRERFYLIQKS